MYTLLATTVVIGDGLMFEYEKAPRNGLPEAKKCPRRRRRVYFHSRLEGEAQRPSLSYKKD